MLQLIRYGLVGVVSNLTIYFGYLLVTDHGVEPKMTMTLLYIVGVATGFYGNRQWTFAHKGVVLGSSIRYFVAHSFGYLINFVILFNFVDRLGYPHQWVQAGAIVIVAGYLFLAFKYFVFPDVEGGTRDTK